MRLFQIITLPFIAAMLIVNARNLLVSPGRRVASTFWMLLWLSTMAAVAYPDTTTRLARTLGIYRGADLLVYSAVIAFIAGFYVVSLRLRQMSREITVLTREVALLEAERKQDGPSSPQA